VEGIVGKGMEMNRIGMRLGGAWIGISLVVLISGHASAEVESESAAKDPYDFVDEKPDYADIDSYGVEDPASDSSTADGAKGPDLSGAEAGSADAPIAEDSSSWGERAGRAGEVTMDAVVLRPLGAVATGIGAGFWLTTTPFMVFSNEFKAAGDAFVGERYRETFKRPIGQF